MTGKFYYTGRSPRALLQRFRIWRAYRRPVTFRDMLKISHDVMYRDGNYHRPDPAAEALFLRIIKEAEKPVWRQA